MSNALSIFEFETNQVRTVMMDGEPWFVAGDVSKYWATLKLVQ